MTFDNTECFPMVISAPRPEWTLDAGERKPVGVIATPAAYLGRSHPPYMDHLGGKEDHRTESERTASVTIEMSVADARFVVGETGGPGKKVVVFILEDLPDADTDG